MTLVLGLIFCCLFLVELNQTRKNIYNVTHECIYNLGNIFNNDGECVFYGYNYNNEYKYFIIGNKLNNIDCNIQYKCIISKNINNNIIFSICDNKLYTYSFNIQKWVNQYSYVYKNNNYYVFNGEYDISYISGVNVSDMDSAFNFTEIKSWVNNLN